MLIHPFRGLLYTQWDVTCLEYTFYRGANRLLDHSLQYSHNFTEPDLTNRRTERKIKLHKKKVLMIYKKAESWLLTPGSSHSTLVVVCGRQITSDYT